MSKDALAVRQSFSNDFLRPRYHFLPPSNWMNDPNGFIQWQGKYHLFYQHNPFGALWGNMHWGHTVSEDLIHWTDLPIALFPTVGGPDEAGCFSGCAVNNGVPTFIYTGTRGERNEVQTQCVATGDADLIHWEKHPANPVIAEVPAVSGQQRDFRDPYVWKEADGWYMVLGSRIQDVGGAVFLYRSQDLQHWEYLHPLLVGDIKRNGVIWECPNFFKLGDRWILVISSHVGNATDTVIYFVGDYKDHQFTPVYEGVVDYGQFYAPLSMRDDQNRLLMLGWLRESRSVEQQAAAGWSGVQSVPRVLELRDDRLTMTPVPALDSIRGQRHSYSASTIPSGGTLDVKGRSLDIQATFAANLTSDCGLSLARSADGEERFDIVYEAASQRLVIRSRTSEADASQIHADGRRTVSTHFGFAEEKAAAEAPVQVTQSIPHPLQPGEQLQLRILLDASVVEIIANERASFTYRLYTPVPDHDGLQVIGDPQWVEQIDVWEMPSIWQSSQS
ncbi:MAG: glycoside hydrolase family 32 protein [Chloroflexi bacterium]|nr:glycoside hydrolase family 32 protein [Chloroflexota bacterium]MCC6893020.1 glycoside hydrolase family 32 protein [Anaerolineae bacterium]